MKCAQTHNWYGVSLSEISGIRTYRCPFGPDDPVHREHDHLTTNYLSCPNHKFLLEDPFRTWVVETYNKEGLDK